MKVLPVTRLCASAAILVAPLMLAGCGDSDASAGSGPRVVTAFYPLQYVAERVAGEHAEVSTLTEPGGEPHDLELSLKQTGEVEDADLVIYQKDFQSAVDDAVETTGQDRVVDAAEIVDLMHVDESAEEHEEHAEEEGEDHGHGEVDPHFWLDPTRLALVGDAVAEELAEIDPDNADDYRTNNAALQADLTKLDEDVTAGLANCTIDTVVASHDAFGYLGARYGIHIEAINGLSPDAEPSPAHIKELRDLIEEHGITTVFNEELASPELADALADDLGLDTAVLDPIEGLAEDTADEDYVSLMRNNLAALQKANDCT
jgi:zinc transport system substrate-binding protein